MYVCLYVCMYVCIWRFPKIRVPKNGWFIEKNPIEMDDDLGIPLFQETTIWVYLKNGVSLANEIGKWSKTIGIWGAP